MIDVVLTVLAWVSIVGGFAAIAPWSSPAIRHPIRPIASPSMIPPAMTSQAWWTGKFQARART